MRLQTIPQTCEATKATSSQQAASQVAATSMQQPASKYLLPEGGWRQGRSCIFSLFGAEAECNITARCLVVQLHEPPLHIVACIEMIGNWILAQARNWCLYTDVYGFIWIGMCLY